MKQKIFEVLQLEDGEKYIGINKKEFDGQEYYLLMQEKKPNLMAVATVGEELLLVEDKELYMKILNLFALDPETCEKIKSFVSFK